MSTPRAATVLPLVAVAMLVMLAALAVWRMAGSGRAGEAASTIDGAGGSRGLSVDRPPSAEPPTVGVTTYTVVPGDTLGAIAMRFGTTVEALLAANELRDPDAIYIGQELRLAVAADRDGPALRTVPDSEVVFGPAYVGFDAAAFVRSQGGPLRDHVEAVDGLEMSGPEIVERVAGEFSVGPRVLLAFVESRSGWVTGTPPAEPLDGDDYPAGLQDPIRSGLWLQLNWLADRINSGYYDWKTRDSRLLTLSDGAHLRGHESLGPGSFAIQRALALQSSEAELEPRLRSFDEANRRLFGDPWAKAVDTPVPGHVGFPRLSLPWAEGETWWLTGGPHGGWADGSAWSAVDFVPDDELRGCYVSDAWVTAPADAVALRTGEGQVWLDLDGDGLRQTGPAVFFLHLAADGVVAHGTRVEAGDRLGHPSCEGGFSNATHVHVARLFDGEWLAAAGDDPLTLGRWRTGGAPSAYDGTLTDDRGTTRHACECREAGHNDVTW